jgi:hypothetical protein
MSTASRLIDNLESKLKEVQRWASYNDEWYEKLVVRKADLESQQRKLGTCESFIAQIKSEAQTRGLDYNDRLRIAEAEGLAKSLKRRLQDIGKGRFLAIFGSVLNVLTSIINGISAIVNLVNAGRSHDQLPPAGGSSASS